MNKSLNPHPCWCPSVRLTGFPHPSSLLPHPSSLLLLLLTLLPLSLSAKGSFNPWPTDNPIAGFTVGYTSKTSTIRSEGEKYRTGFLPSETDFTPSLHMGLIINPEFKFGLGLRTGIFFEYARQKYEPDDNLYSITWHDISLEMPVQASFRIRLGGPVTLQLYTGPVVDAGHWNKIIIREGATKITINNLYNRHNDNNQDYHAALAAIGWDQRYHTSSNRYDAWNILWGAGAAIGFSRFRVDISTGWGMRNMSHDDSFTRYNNKPIRITFTTFFVK